MGLCSLGWSCSTPALLAMERLHELLRWGAGEAFVSAGARGCQQEKHQPPPQRPEEWWVPPTVCLFLCLFCVLLFWLLSLHLSTVYDVFAAQDCFQRIDRRLRATLRRKQIPLVSALLGRYQKHLLRLVYSIQYMVGVDVRQMGKKSLQCCFLFLF